MTMIDDCETDTKVMNIIASQPLIIEVLQGSFDVPVLNACDFGPGSATLDSIPNYHRQGRYIFALCLFITLRASCSAVYCNRSSSGVSVCLCVCG